MLLHTNVGEHGLDNAEPSGVDLLSLIAIDPGLHLIDQIQRLGSNLVCATGAATVGLIVFGPRLVSLVR